ncbi:MAG: glycosyltransferase 87 family protein, partial [Chthoniobacterales bacterium]|nr:glycosyltransferase 87 family protein [Chthoniobacterales bacterium]
PNYRQAAEKWWHGEQSIYISKKSGFLYLPHAAIIYTPFVLPPKRIGEPLWRIVSLTTLAWAIWRSAKILPAYPSTNTFALLSILTIPSSFASAANGQMNLLLSALLLHATIDLSRNLTIRPLLLLLLATALKPHALIFLLLVATVFPRFLLPTLFGTCLFLLAPFIHPKPSYVLNQYTSFSHVLISSTLHIAHEYCDLTGLARTLGIHLPQTFWFLLRSVAALVTLALAWSATRNHPSPLREFLTLALATTYLMLFNPRTEANSYILLTPSVAWLTALLSLPALKTSPPPLPSSPILAHSSCSRPSNQTKTIQISDKTATPIVLALYLLSLGSDSYGPIHNWTNLWLKALLTLIFALWLAKFCIQSRPSIVTSTSTIKPPPTIPPS